MVNKKSQSSGIFNTKRSLIAAIVAAIMSLVAVFFFSLLAVWEVIPETAIPVISVIITVAGAFFAGYLVALSVSSMGLLNGLLSGAFYFLVMFLISSVIAPGFSLNKTTFINLVLSLVSAGIGGSVSINLKANRRNRRRRAR